jgi:putative FmdB family regulatory protein
MPIYLYQCDTCGLRFERLQHMSEEPLRECPECGGDVHRVIQPVGIIFKGSGFYVTDNRQGSSSTLSTPKEDKAKADTTEPVSDGESKETSSPAEKTGD